VSSRLVPAFSLAIFGILTAQGGELRAGVARGRIPVAAGCALAGFERRATGVRDPLEARALVLRSGDTSAAVVACDLHSFSSKRVAEEARRRMGIGLVVLACSGSYSAPGLTARWPGYDAWAREADDAILAVISQAARSTFRARLGVTSILSDIGYNWRSIDEEGKVTMLWRNPEHRLTGPLASSAAVWRIDDESGAMRAIVFHAACRASSLNRENLEVSADYPGAAARRVEAELGGHVVSLFLQGASGNVVPYGGGGAGDRLGRDVAEAARSITPPGDVDGSLQVFREALTFRERWGSHKSVSTEIASVVINRRAALAAIPGAPFVEHQIALADRSLIPGTLLVGHAFTENSAWLGILPTIRGAAQGGYGASGGDTRLEPGAGEAMVDAALIHIYRALGKLDEIPRGDLVRETPPEGRRR
jgi:hypothetical protein